mmetsp:Transcript_25301/g.51607  ORF Transcript_25301/g.51607 Transcript_25301/m.51607 type:complete len:130 (+) Transcript_25301:274-663(+)
MLETPSINPKDSFETKWNWLMTCSYNNRRASVLARRNGTGLHFPIVRVTKLSKTTDSSYAPSPLGKRRRFLLRTSTDDSDDDRSGESNDGDEEPDTDLLYLRDVTRTESYLATSPTIGDRFRWVGQRRR